MLGTTDINTITNVLNILNGSYSNTSSGSAIYNVLFHSHSEHMAFKLV